jgi:prepilin-type N-terminal cleavage/methylation domain-containing protein
MKERNGFTLVEALVAFSILAVSAVAIYGAVGTSVMGLARSGRVDEATLIAQSQLAHWAAARALPAAGQGQVEGTPYRWRFELVPDSTPEPPDIAVAPLRAQRIKLSLEWDENGRRRAVVLDHILLLRRGPGG